MTNERTSRSQTTRVTETRVANTWKPANDLPNPDPRPGWGHRWIRTSMANVADHRSMSTALREGWEPVRAADYPEINLYFDSRSAGDSPNGNIELGGLILCRRPEEINRQRDKHYQDMTAQQAFAVDNNVMRENDARMPLFSEKQSKVSFGRGG